MVTFEYIFFPPVSMDSFFIGGLDDHSSRCCCPNKGKRTHYFSLPVDLHLGGRLAKNGTVSETIKAES